MPHCRNCRVGQVTCAKRPDDRARERAPHGVKSDFIGAIFFYLLKKYPARPKKARGNRDSFTGNYANRCVCTAIANQNRQLDTTKPDSTYFLSKV